VFSSIESVFGKNKKKPKTQLALFEKNCNNSFSVDTEFEKMRKSQDFFITIPSPLIPSLKDETELCFFRTLIKSYIKYNQTRDGLIQWGTR
jgi:hypothetical protein